MISRALARDIASFTNLLESHLSRMIEVIHRRMRRLGKDERDQLIRDSLVLAFRDREAFDPVAESVMTWFGRCVEEAMLGSVAADPDELAMLSSFAHGVQTDIYFIDEAGSLPAQIATSSSHEDVVVGSEPASRAKADAIQKPGKDCPPCWRCRFFDGWLPHVPPKKSNYSNNEMGWLCYEIDQRKIAIAHYVRGEYPTELLED